MAVVRPQAANGSASLKAALIAFAAVAVAALGFAVYLYTQHSDLEAAARSSADRARQADQSARDAKQDFVALTTEAFGQPVEDLAQVRQRVSEVRTTITQDARVAAARQIPRDSSLMTVLQEVYALYGTTADALAKADQDRKDLNARLEKTVADARAIQEQFTAEAAELKQQYEQLARDNATLREEMNNEIARLKAEHQQQFEAARGELQAERQRREATQAALDTEQERSRQLLAQLAQFKPTGDQFAVLQLKDGTILDTFAGDDVVYISLGRRDGIKTGMTFSVYSAFDGIPESGEGKATIEVSNLFENTAECRVTSKTMARPIVKGDIIANPVFDKSRRLRFAVIGDFDLNFDGEVDDAEGRQVARLIQAWGGQLTDQVDTRTDFLVLGAEPPTPASLDPDQAPPAALERAQELEKRREAYQQVLTQARSLSVTVLPRTQFLAFLGYAAPERKPAAQAKAEEPAQ